MGVSGIVPVDTKVKEDSLGVAHLKTVRASSDTFVNMTALQYLCIVWCGQGPVAASCLLNSACMEPGSRSLTS